MPSILLAFLLHSLPASAVDLQAGGSAGYLGGPAGELSLALSGLTLDAPLAFRMGMAYASRPAGKAEDARSIFINDNTNGVPEKDGHAWIWKADLWIPLDGSGKGKADPFRGSGAWVLFGGPRYSWYTAHFKYVGGNEDFDVRSGQWGLGGGLERCFALSPAADLRFSAGADYFFEAELDGHDTAYSPDGEHVSPRKDYDWEDADDAIDQPGLEIRVTLGVGYRIVR